MNINLDIGQNLAWTIIVVAIAWAASAWARRGASIVVNGVRHE